MRRGDINSRAFENGRPVLVCWPEIFIEREQLDANTARRVEIRLAALRLLCGLTAGSEADEARRIGCTRAAISAATCRLARGLGLEHLLRKSSEARLKLSAATARSWKNKRAVNASTLAAQSKLSTYEDSTALY